VGRGDGIGLGVGLIVGATVEVEVGGGEVGVGEGEGELVGVRVGEGGTGVAVNVGKGVAQLTDSRVAVGCRAGADSQAGSTRTSSAAVRQARAMITTNPPTKICPMRNGDIFMTPVRSP
jgi:hypothetical protein